MYAGILFQETFLTDTFNIDNYWTIDTHMVKSAGPPLISDIFVPYD